MSWKWQDCFWSSRSSAASNTYFCTSFCFPTNSFFVFARCQRELSPWFSLISVERCFTYWTSACELPTRPRTSQTKVDAANWQAWYVRTCLAPSHPSTLTSCGCQMSANKINTPHSFHVQNDSCFLYVFFSWLQECGQRMTEREVSSVYSVYTAPYSL